MRRASTEQDILDGVRCGRPRDDELVDVGHEQRGVVQAGEGQQCRIVQQELLGGTLMLPLVRRGGGGGREGSATLYSRNCSGAPWCCNW